MKNMKKLLAILLCVIMLFSVFTVMAVAEDKDYYSLSDLEPEKLDKIYDPSNYETAFSLDCLFVGLNKGIAIDENNLLGSAQSLLPEVTLTDVKDKTVYKSSSDPDQPRTPLTRTILFIYFEERTKQGVIDIIDALKYNPNVAYSEPNHIYGIDDGVLDTSDEIDYSEYIKAEPPIMDMLVYYDTNEDITVSVITPKTEKFYGIKNFVLLNENGMKISTKNLRLEEGPYTSIPQYAAGENFILGSAKSEGSNIMVWRFTFSVGTPNKSHNDTRKIRCIPVNGEGEMTDCRMLMELRISPFPTRYTTSTVYSVGQSFETIVSIPSDGSYDTVKSFNVYNEKGNRITITDMRRFSYDACAPNVRNKSFILGSRTADSYNIWRFKISICTAGTRTLTIVPVTASGEKTEDAFTINTTIVPEEGADSVRAASFDADSVRKNERVTATVITGSQVKSLNVCNEKNAKMGKSVTSKTVSSDGSITWKLSMSIGTAGSRTFTVRPNGATDNGAEMGITVI